MEKKETNYGALSAICALLAVVFICLSWGHVGKFGMPLANSLAALITGIICLCKKDSNNRTLAIIGIIVSVPTLIISVLWTVNFMYLVC